MKTPEDRLEDLRMKSDYLIHPSVQRKILLELREAVAETREECARVCDQLAIEARESPIHADKVKEYGAFTASLRIRALSGAGEKAQVEPTIEDRVKRLEETARAVDREILDRGGSYDARIRDALRRINDLESRVLTIEQRLDNHTEAHLNIYRDISELRAWRERIVKT